MTNNATMTRRGGPSELEAEHTRGGDAREQLARSSASSVADARDTAARRGDRGALAQLSDAELAQVST